jgi:hypothetical protein
MDSGAFIRELCIALEHRCEPDSPFLIFTAYFDESDTHGPSPNLILAGFLGSAREWQLFGRRIRALQRRDGFKIFHAKDFKAGRGEFRGWDQAKRSRLVSDLATAIRDNLTEGVTVTLPRELYVSEYRAPPVPKGMTLDSQYGACFRFCLYRLLQTIADTKKKHSLNIVIEYGHHNACDCVRVFNEFKDQLSDIAFPILGTITIARKSECWPLMIADFQAHATFMSEARVKAGHPGYFELAGIKEPPRGQAALTQLIFTPDTLRGFKAAWVEAKQARIDRWRAARGR